MYSFTYGKSVINYQLLFVQRKTMEIAVHPDNSIVVKAPEDTPIDTIELKLKKRARWILNQRKYFNQFIPKTPNKQFIGGESHLYLGRHYRLKILEEGPVKVKLSRGFFTIYCGKDKNSCDVEKLMINWYKEKAIQQFSSILNNRWTSSIAENKKMPHMVIKRMKTRWGSLSQNGILTLNINLIKAPKECIDYVITHELCHLKYNDHGTKFYKLLETILPNWEKIKHKLELSMN
ncbi:MAG: SprT family zinc-dependent metalloprotease [Candidatus Delongbacteria bacterium]|jgi:predicted metal-dependent hydrolase|nr:SprT family zinc-dependent metalloprotease [Candidatus Delongbacteria bacterium]